MAVKKIDLETSSAQNRGINIHPHLSIAGVISSTHNKSLTTPPTLLIDQDLIIRY